MRLWPSGRQFGATAGLAAGLYQLESRHVSPITALRRCSVTHRRGLPELACHAGEISHARQARIPAGKPRLLPIALKSVDQTGPNPNFVAGDDPAETRSSTRVTGQRDLVSTRSRTRTASQSDSQRELIP